MQSSWFFLSAVISLGALGCANAQASFPAVTDEPTGRHDAGRIVSRVLISDRPAESKRFYEELFRWELEAVGSRYRLGADGADGLIRRNGRLIGGTSIRIGGRLY
ncbi:MAG TPA: hypothetical protein VIS76_05440 [Pseudomonadales bacterium]